LPERRIAITGVGAVCPLGLTAEETWQSMLEGRSGIGPITRFDASEFTARIAGQVKGFDPSRWLGPKEVRHTDPYAQYGIAAAALAVEDSGIDFAREDTTRGGVVIGSGIGGFTEMEEQYSLLQERGPGRVSPFLIPKMMPNAATGHIMIRFGLTGPNSATSTACASANHAFCEAFFMIRSGEAHVVIAGAAEAALTPLGLSGFASLKALSRRNDDPEGASRPFDRDRDGFVLSEGAGVVVLEEMEHARRRGARIYAEFCGIGRTGDACHITAPDPTGRGAALAMSRALEMAGLAPEDIDYINAHGTSTKLNDLMETRAIKRAMGPAAERVAISSTKSVSGHLLGATGGIEMIAVAMAVHTGRIPPTINYDHPDPECDLDYVPNVAREAPVTAAMSNSFGFGGHNACLVVKKV